MFVRRLACFSMDPRLPALAAEMADHVGTPAELVGLPEMPSAFQSSAGATRRTASACQSQASDLIHTRDESREMFNVLAKWKERVLSDDSQTT